MKWYHVFGVSLAIAFPLLMSFAEVPNSKQQARVDRVIRARKARAVPLNERKTCAPSITNLRINLYDQGTGPLSTLQLGPYWYTTYSLNCATATTNTPCEVVVVTEVYELIDGNLEPFDGTTTSNSANCGVSVNGTELLTMGENVPSGIYVFEISFYAGTSPIPPGTQPIDTGEATVPYEEP